MGVGRGQEMEPQGRGIRVAWFSRRLRGGLVLSGGTSGVRAGRVPVGERGGSRGLPRGGGDGGSAARVRVGVQEAHLSPGPWGRRAGSTVPPGGGPLLWPQGLGTRGRPAGGDRSKGRC